MLNWIPLTEPQRMPEACGLYLIRHRATGREYVGKSLNLRSRAYDHRRARTGVTYLYRAIRKHGAEAFDICVFALGSEQEMLALEIATIAARGTFNPAGFNQTHGGDGVSGYRATPEARAAMSAARLGRPNSEETKAKMRETRLAHNPFKGRKHTPETKARMAATLRQQRADNPPTAAQTAATLAMNARKVGTTHSEETRALISKRLKGGKKPEGFGIGVLAGEKNGMYGVKGAKHPRAKQVLAWLPGSLTPVSFDTADEAAAWASCSISSMSLYCSGKQRASSGILYSHA